MTGSPTGSVVRAIARWERSLLLGMGGVLLLLGGLLAEAAGRGAFVRATGAPLQLAVGVGALALFSLAVRRRTAWKPRLTLALLTLSAAVATPWAHARHVADLRAAAETPARVALLGTQAPALDWIFAINMTPEREAALHDPRGRLLLADFWATWCAPCVEHMPKLEALHREQAGELLVVGLTKFYGEDLSPAGVHAEIGEIRSFVEDLGITYPIVVVADEAVHARYHVDSLPTSVLVGRDGSVIDYGIGIVGSAEVFEHATRLAAR